MGRVIIHEGLVNETFVARATSDFEAYRQSVEVWTLDRAEAVTGIFALPKGNWRARALRPDGSLGAEVPVTKRGGNGPPLLRMSPEHRTLCYWLVRGDAP